jgi:hypothetical protein
VKNGADINKKDISGDTAFIAACKYGTEKTGIDSLVRTLLNNKADPFIADSDGKIPYNYLCEKSQFRRLFDDDEKLVTPQSGNLIDIIAAAECGDVESARKILASDAKIKPDKLQRALQVAAEKNFPKIMAIILQQKDFKTEKLKLQNVVMNGSIDSLKYAVEKELATGKDMEFQMFCSVPYTQKRYEYTPGQEDKISDCTLYLYDKLHDLKYPIDKNGTQIFDKSIAFHGSDYLIKGFEARHFPFSLSALAGLGKTDEVKAILEKTPERLNEIPYPYREIPLACAVQMKRLETAKMLLELGADPNYEKTCSPCIIIATRNNDIDMVKLLLNHKADPNIKDIGNSVPPPALLDAVQNKNYAIAEELLKAGADPNWGWIRDKYGKKEKRNLRYFARDDSKMTKLLKQYGAK